MTEPGEQGSGDWETGRWKMVSPGWGIPDRGWCVGPDGDGLLSGFYYSAKGPVSRILSCAVIPLDAASPRTFISDLPGGFINSSNRLSASGRCAAPHGSLRTLPSLFGLAPCGVYPAPGVTAGAVRSYRTISPLPRRWSFRNGERTRQAGQLGYCVSREALRSFPKKRGGVAEAVSFLWHWPSMCFEAHVPDVIRHTALRSSDFPPPANLARAKKPAATARSSCL